MIDSSQGLLASDDHAARDDAGTSKALLEKWLDFVYLTGVSNDLGSEQVLSPWHANVVLADHREGIPADSRHDQANAEVDTGVRLIAPGGAENRRGRHRNHDM